MDLEELRMLKADQNAKLLCFCTGPAIYNPPLNWLCEFMSSVIFVRTWPSLLASLHIACMVDVDACVPS